jgi:hypothetical protein
MPAGVIGAKKEGATLTDIARYNQGGDAYAGRGVNADNV